MTCESDQRQLFEYALNDILQTVECIHLCYLQQKRSYLCDFVEQPFSREQARAGLAHQFLCAASETDCNRMLSIGLDWAFPIVGAPLTDQLLAFRKPQALQRKESHRGSANFFSSSGDLS